MKILDTHVHFRDVTALRYPWIEQGSPFDRTYAPADYRLASGDSSVGGMIFIEADADSSCSLSEALWVHGLAAFGPSRVLFGSDWPVCELAGGFAKWLAVAQTLAAPWSPEERESFFVGNAERVYRLR